MCLSNSMTDTLACHDIGSGVNTHRDGYEHTSAMTVEKQTPAPTGLHVVDPRHRSSAVWLVVEPLPGISFACQHTYSSHTHTLEGYTDAICCGANITTRHEQQCTSPLHPQLITPVVFHVMEPRPHFLSRSHDPT